MPGRTTQDESGWYYHSPFVNSKSEKPSPKPLMSQIPGINGGSDVKAAGLSRPYYRDTDSKYVRLAKQGGTKDLLNYPEFDYPKEAVAYARNDWYYSEDNAVEDAKNKIDMNWKFGVPDYMSNVQRSLESGDQKDEILKFEALKMADNEQANPDSMNSPHTGQQFPNPAIDCNLPMASSDQTVNQPEIKNERSQMSQIMSPCYNIERVKAVIPEQEFRNPILQKEYSHSLPTGHSRKQGNEKEGNEVSNSLPAGFTRKQGSDKEGTEVSMSKLLSHTYGKEWHARLKDTQNDSRRLLIHAAQEDNIESENNINQTTKRTPESF